MEQRETGLRRVKHPTRLVPARPNAARDLGRSKTFVAVNVIPLHDYGASGFS